MNDQLPYRDGRGRWERLLEDYSGWGRLLVTLLFLAAQAAYFARGLSDQAETQVKTTIEFQKQLTELNSNIKDLSGQVTRLALSNERVSVELLDHARRIDDNGRRLEKIEDGRHR